MQVQIIFTARGSSTVTGNFAPGDTLRCSAEHARHLVDEAQCARYAVASTQADMTDEKPAAALSAKRARRATGA